MISESPKQYMTLEVIQVASVGLEGKQLQASSEIQAS